MTWLGRHWCASAHTVLDWRVRMPQESTQCSWHMIASMHVQGGDKSFRASGIRDSCQTLKNAWNLIRKKQRKSQYYVSSISLTWAILVIIIKKSKYFTQFIPCFIIVHNLKKHWIRLVLNPKFVHPIISLKSGGLYVEVALYDFPAIMTRERGCLLDNPGRNFNSIEIIFKNWFQNWNKQGPLNWPKQQLVLLEELWILFSTKAEELH